MNAIQRADESTAESAFTLIDLLLILAALGVLGCTLLVAAPRLRVDAQKILCLNEKRQLCAAWRFYADDNAGKLVPNVHGGSTVGGGSGPTAWVTGWLDWSTATDNTNVALLVDQRYAILAPYLNRATNLFKCPADKYLSGVQAARGWTQRVRSVAASVGIGEGNAQTGPWVTIYKQIKKLSDFLYPLPAETYVFLDEHPDSINDP